MSMSVSVGGGANDLLGAIGLTGADGQIDGEWFNDPIGNVGQVLSDPQQRAALLRLLDTLLPAAPDRPGWHPLLNDQQIGNLYLTVEGDVIGAAGALHAEVADGITLSASVRLPLVNIAGELRPIAGSAEGPVQLGVEVAFDDPTLPLRAIAVDVTIDVDRGAGFIARITGLDIGGGPTDIEIDSAELGPDLIDALQVLLREALEALSDGDPRLGRLAEHLFALLGLDGADGIPALPIQQLLSDPAVIRDWLIGIVSQPATLAAWATHLAGLIGDDRAPSGDASADHPLHAPLLSAGPVDLDLVVNLSPSGGELELGLSVNVNAGPADLDASVTALRIPLSRTGATEVVPRAAVLLVTPGTGQLVSNAPAIQIGTLRAGFRLERGQVQPWLALTDVVLDDVTHGVIDLTDADAVTGVVTDQVDQLLADAFGDNAAAHALLALLGLEAPAADPSTPHGTSVLDLLRSPLPALAALHRAVLADPEHDWSAMLASLASLLGLPGPVAGAGTSADPWRVAIASAGPAALSLAAWNARDDAAPAGLQQLRLGLLASADVAPFHSELRSELLAIDLPASGSGRVGLLGEQRVLLRAAPIGPLTTPLGLVAGADSASGTARWKPGEPLSWHAEIAGLSVRAGTESYGPLTVSWPASPGPAADQAAAAESMLGDLGLGVLRMLLGEALHAWGGDAPYVLGALLGAHRGLPALPPDWPVLDPPGGLDELFDDPGAALRDVLHRMLTGVSADGQAFATTALRILGALLRSWEAPAGSRPAIDVAIGGSGTYDDPWSVPLPGTSTGGAETAGAADLLVWLDPDGPPADWLGAVLSRLSGVGDGAGLASFLSSIAAFDPALRDLLRDRADLGAGLDAVAAWLRDGDGLVPLASALPGGARWTHGQTVAAPHVSLPADPGVIAQVGTQLGAWAAQAVVLVSPSFADRTAWATLLTQLAPGRPDAAHFDLRSLADPADFDVASVTATATLYTADLRAGAGLSEQAQLERVVRRVQQLTGAGAVAIVAHSTAGIPARLLAAAHPELVRGLITIGTPHAPSSLGPLRDDAQAAAVRVARTVVSSISSSAVGASVAQLGALLDGAAGPLGGPLDQAARAAFVDGPAALIGIVDTVPGLAIGSALGGDPIGLIAGAAATGASGAAHSPTHVGLGARVHLDVPPAAAGEIAVTASARVDLTRIRLAPGAPEPARPATAAVVAVQARRPGDWLVGAELTGADAAVRVRWLEAGVSVATGAPVAPGTVTAAPWLRLHDAGAQLPLSLADLAALPAEARDAAATALRRALDAVLAELRTAAAGTPARMLLDLLRAAGLTVEGVVDGAADVRTAAAGLDALVVSPVVTLRAHRDALIDVLRQALGLPAGPLVVVLGDLPLQLELDVAAGTLRLRSTADLELAGPLKARLDATVPLASLQLRADASLVAGPVALTGASDGTISIAAPPWLDQLALRPARPEAIRAAIIDVLPRVAVSAAITVLLGDRVGASIGPVDALLRDPVGWLRRADVFGSPGGGLDGDKINSLLKTLAGAVGLDNSQGLALPGGYLVRAAGDDPARITLSGQFDVPDVAMFRVDVGVDILRNRSVAPAAQIGATFRLPGNWGQIGVDFSLDETGVGLLVTPQQNAQPIRLLPTVDGLGLLVGGAVALVPRLLQEAVTWLKAQPGPHEVLDVVLNLAAGLGIYGDDANGFIEPSRVAALRRMLEPGWLETQIADSGALAGLIASMFGPAPRIVLPAGHQITRVEDRLRWTMPVLPGADVTVEPGWGAGGAPQILVGLTGLDTGPVVIAEAQLGWADGLTGVLRLRADPGGDLAFFTPELAIAVTANASGAAFGLRILPLGEAQATHVAIVLAPQPALTLDGEGGAALAGQWLVPLIARFVLPLVEDLLDEPIWTGGPTARGILAGAGVIEPGPGTPQIVATLPALPELGLGALAALANGATIPLTPTLSLSAVAEDGRLGLRVAGTIPIDGDDVDVTVLFGRTLFGDGHGWLTSADAGVTAWVLRNAPGQMPPFAIDPGLSIGGLGVDVRGHGDDPLIDGAFTVGGLAALFFVDIEFLNPAGQFALEVGNFGGAVELNEAKIVLSSDDADSFVSKLLPEEMAAGFSLALAYRNGALELHSDGVGDSDTGIELTFPLDLDILGVIFLRELLLAVDVPAGHVDLLAAISGNASLGPVAVAVDRVGLRARIQGGSVQFGFKPPDGFGLSMDVSVVKVGGFLLVDEEHGRYVGAIEIAVLQKFSLTAIGIVTTKKPDGSPGFSLLLLVTVTLPVPIPIGYGFFFAGAGGLLGLNRGMDVDRIRTGLRTGTADSILFPTDIVRRIDVIVRDLEESFPQAEGHFLIAPMAFIQWMNPALVTAKVGVIIEIADPPSFAILGVLRIALPTPDEAVVDLKVAFLGSIDIGAGLLSFDASIYDSYIGYGDIKLSLEGDIAIRISWGAHPDLVASIGGFHPNYRPDASLKLPDMRRLTLSLLKDNPRITLKLYFAVTSNTVQFGASLELYVGVAGFSIAGDMGFDVLVQVAPFLIDAHMWAHLAVKAGSTDICSISLDLSLRGPTPWIAHGQASISILFFSISVEVEARFGEDSSTSLPSVPVLDRLLEQLRDPKNWTAELSADASPSVTLLPTGTDLVVDAGGQLSVRQSLLPLATDIGLVGAAPPADIRRATITALQVGAESTFDDVMAGYAPSTFAGAPAADADRLRAPAFEQRPTGARSRGGSALVGSIAVGHQVAYERIVLDDPDQPATPPKVTPPVTFGRLIAGGAVGASAGSALRRTNAERGSVLAAGAAEPLFAVTALDDLTPLDHAGAPSAGSARLTRADAQSRLEALSARGARVQIVPEAQLVH